MHHRRLAFVILATAAAGCPSSNLPGLEIDMSVPPARDLTVDPCRNFMRDGEETATDCGGPTCMPCDTGDGCKMGRDCASGFCTNAKCDAPSCSDGGKNGTESDKDCGGTCPGCEVGKKCTAGADCASKTCTNGACVLGPCMNGKQDGSETDKDCGGSDCGPCDDGRMCVLGTDCTGMICTNNVCHGALTCVAPTANCDGNDANGCETNTDTDAKNCGKCGTVCPKNKPTCAGGSCRAGTIIFISSANYDANFGSLAGADANCAGLAKAAGLGDNFKAWLSDSKTTASSRLTHSQVPYVLADGTVVAADWAGLTSGKLLHPINLSEKNGPPTPGDLIGGWQGVRTSTVFDGSFSGSSCGDWTRLDQFSGGYGIQGATDRNWTDAIEGEECKKKVPIFCLQQ